MKNIITILKQIRRYAYIDNEDYFKKIKIKAGYQTLHKDKHSDTKLYLYLETLDDWQLRQAVLYAMLGRDYSRHYGGIRGIVKPSEYLTYLRERREVLKLGRDYDTMFIFNHRLEIVSYIDKVLRIIGEE